MPTVKVKKLPALDDYLSAQTKLFEYFGYVEDWCVIPVEDGREFFWKLSGESRGDTVKFHESAHELSDERDEEGNFYQDEIYTQCHLSKWVYRGAEFTIVCVDTQTDGNKFLRIFDNAKEIK